LLRLLSRGGKAGRQKCKYAKTAKRAMNELRVKPELSRSPLHHISPFRVYSFRVYTILILLQRLAARI
jgi:hypothetical protein